MILKKQIKMNTLFHKIPAALFDSLLDELYPIRLGLIEEPSFNVESQYADWLRILNNNLVPSEKADNRVLVRTFLDQIPLVKEKLDEDIEAILKGDPAATGATEIVLTYPGFYAIAAYRIAHLLYDLNVPLIPRIITEHAHAQTGIDIHPGATIGRAFFIDHGTGVVIGETSVIGDRVKLYQGVTLGGLSPRSVAHNDKRHPTIEDDVVLYAQATILGGETTIGKGSIIGGNVWLTESVPAQSKVFYKPSIESTVYA